MPSWKTIRSAVGQLWLVFLAGLLCLGVVEGALRLKSRWGEQRGYRVTQPNGLVTLEPALDTLIRGSTGELIHFKTNHEGFASENHAVVAATGTKRIAFLGNSFTQGTDVDYEKKMTTLIQRLYPKTSDGQKVEIMNFAIGGYSIVEQMVLYNEYVRKYRPAAVILVSYVGYDFSTNLRFLPEQKIILEGDIQALTAATVKQATDAFTKQQQTLKNRLVATFEVVRFLIRLTQENQTLNTAAVNLGLLKQPFSEQAANYLTDIWAYFNPNSAPHREVMEFTAATIKRLQSQITRDGASFGLVLIPSYWQVNEKYIAQLKAKHIPLQLDLPNTTLKKQLNNALPILDLSTPIYRALNTERTPIFIKDIGHFTEQGNSLAAEQIVEFLKANEFQLRLKRPGKN